MGLSSGLGLDTELGDDDVGMAGRESVTEAINVEETEASVCVFCFLFICFLDPMMTWQVESSRCNTRVGHSNPIRHRWNFNLHVKDGVFKVHPRPRPNRTVFKTNLNMIQHSSEMYAKNSN